MGRLEQPVERGPQSDEKLDGVDRQLSALADPTRRAVYDIVRATPSSVTAVAKQLPVSQPAVSQHLRVLTDANLVVATPSGARRIYRADPAGVQILRSWIEDLWDDVLDAFTEAAHTEAANAEAGRTGLAATPADTPADKPEDKTADTPEDKTADKPEAKTADKPEAKTADKQAKQKDS